MGILLGLIALGVVVTVHELGHFLAAKLCGVEVESFSLGWGPVLLRKTWRGTEYRLSAFPLGGYCGMKGENAWRTAVEENLDENKYKDTFGYITVIENSFGFKQIFPLREGDNIIGRRCIGNTIQVPIETSDMSMDRFHCIINVKRNKQGDLIYTLRDAPSLTGTFLNNELLEDKDRIRIEEGAIITIGATTFILHTYTPQAPKE